MSLEDILIKSASLGASLSHVKDILMEYDPIKDSLGKFFRIHPVLQRLFFALLHAVFLRSWYVRREVRALLRPARTGQPAEVLDAGTGFGQYAAHIVRRFPGARVLAVDVKLDYLADLRRFAERAGLRDRMAFLEYDLTGPPLDQTFDLIVSVDVMEHIEDDRTVFRNFAQMLREGGHVIVNTPSDQGGSDTEAHGEEGFIGEHVRPGYGLEALRDKMAEAGLETVRARYTYGTFGSIGWRILVKWPMRLLSATRLAFAALPAYYLAALPVGLVLNAIDVRSRNETGTGLILVARKNVKR